MAMYTRCPACKSEIAFEPPANIASLPETYRHRIKCPNCGVTIGVKLNTVARQPVPQTAIAPRSTEERPSSYSHEEHASVHEMESVPARTTAAKKKSGIGRNIIMMIISLLFVGFYVVGYFIVNGTIHLDNYFSYGILTDISPIYGNGLLGFYDFLRSFDTFKGFFHGNLLQGLLTVMPMGICVLAAITFVVAFISACGKKYGRAFNLVWAILTFIVSLLAFFGPFLSSLLDHQSPSFVEYIKYFINKEQYLQFVIPALGFLQLLFSLIFLKSLKIKKHKA